MPNPCWKADTSCEAAEKCRHKHSLPWFHSLPQPATSKSVRMACPVITMTAVGGRTEDGRRMAEPAEDDGPATMGALHFQQCLQNTFRNVVVRRFPVEMHHTTTRDGKTRSNPPPFPFSKNWDASMSVLGTTHLGMFGQSSTRPYASSCGAPDVTCAGHRTCCLK
jgi:hypothetical protein